MNTEVYNNYEVWKILEGLPKFNWGSFVATTSSKRIFTSPILDKKS